MEIKKLVLTIYERDVRRYLFLNRIYIHNLMSFYNKVIAPSRFMQIANCRSLVS